jgi:pyruvate/2-oxoglutarate dehydrogenase complex dihydrolipoamide acyltransferase (E2) component
LTKYCWHGDNQDNTSVHYPRLHEGVLDYMAITQVTMPRLGETVDEGTIGNWLKSEGEVIRRDESLVEIITDKITTELPSPAGGKLVRILVQPDETVKVGTPIAEIEMEVTSQNNTASTPSIPSARTTAPLQAALSAVMPGTMHATSPLVERISPLARRLAAEYHVDLHQIMGTGEGGRIRKEDILAFVQQRDERANGAEPTPTMVAPSAPAPVVAQPAIILPAMSDKDSIITPSPIRRAIAEHMVRSKATSPHATTVVEVDMTAIAFWLERNKATFKQQHGYSITYVPFVAKATCEALRDVPTMNASWTEDNRILQHHNIDMGFAVSTDNGLLVPVLKNADQQSIVEIAAAVSSLATHARSNRLTPDEIQGSTFVITNPGVFGTVFSMPIINQPNAGILSMDAVIKRPVVVEGDAIAVHSMMYLCLSFDHRINDGLEAARFLQSIRRHLEAYRGDINIHRP